MDMPPTVNCRHRLDGPGPKSEAQRVEEHIGNAVLETADIEGCFFKVTDGTTTRLTSSTVMEGSLLAISP